MEQEEISISNYNKSFFTKAIEITIISLIILTPLVFYPYLIRIFNPAKELVFNILVIIGLMFWFLKMTSQEKFALARNPLNLPILSFMAICSLSILWSNSPMVSLLELTLFLVGPLLYFIVVNNVYDEHQINLVMYLLEII